MNTPIAPQLKRDETKKPLKITFNEIVPSCFVKQEIKNEVSKVCDQEKKFTKPGSVYMPNSDPSVAVIKCRTGHFWVKRATLFNSKPQEWSVLAASMLMKPGVVYNDVFVECPKKEDVLSSGKK